MNSYLLKDNRAKSLTYFFKEENNFSIFTNSLIDKIEKESIKNSDSVRICLHHNAEDDLHDMIICHPKGRYIRPHKNPKNSKAYHWICGEMLVIGLDENENILFKTIFSKENPILRINKNIYLFLIVQSQTCIFHEIAVGPFDRDSKTIFAKWSPKQNTQEVNNFINKYNKV